MPPRSTEAWITGVGLVSSLGEGQDEHWRRLGSQAAPVAAVDNARYAPYSVHPLVSLDFTRQIPKTSDQRQMDRWQRIGVYAAGLALADAKVLGEPKLLDKVDLAIAAGNGERDVALDGRVLQAVCAGDAAQGALNQQLMVGLRPTLYLGQLSNLLAGNISIVLKATGSSRTFKGEEMAGFAALDDAARRLTAGQSELMLVGAALNAEREDLLLNLELGNALLRTGYQPVWARSKDGGGMAPGSIGVFLVLETPEHARERGVTPYARVAALASDRSRRRLGDATDTAQAMMERLLPLIADGSSLGVLSGASGVEPATSEEGKFLEYLRTVTHSPAVRAYGSVLGHGIEAHFLSGVALAAMALSKRAFYAPFDGEGREHEPDRECRQVLVTGFGHWRGEALGLIEAISEAAP